VFDDTLLERSLDRRLAMIIIAGYTLTDANARDAAVAAFADLVERARKYDGCLDVSISGDSVDPERINIFEHWRDQKSLDAWRKIAKAPRVKRRETYVKLYRTEKAEKPF
jgi:quinol monooxygenase YgiN